MGALKLFISHSSRLDEIESSNDPAENPNLKLLLDVIALVKQEYGETIEVLVDKDEHGLPVGHDWEKRLNEWLAECHAAIILFSKRAIENSNWVKKEATILSWRRELDKDFKLIPVCIQGQTTPDELTKDLFGTLRIGKVQSVREGGNAQDVLEGIKQALGDQEFLASKCILTPFDKLANVISKLLTRNTDSNTLQNAWNALKNTDKPDWHPNSSTKFSHALTRFLLRNNDDCLAHYKVLINTIRPKVDQKDALEILEYIRPLWIDSKSAGCIPAARSDSPLAPNRFLIMNGKLLPLLTLKRYLERAWPLNLCYKPVFTTAAEKTSLIKEIQDHFQSKRITLASEQCDEKIKTYDRQIIVFLPATEQNGGGLLDDPLLRTELGELYPNIIFLLGCGEQLPDNTPMDISKVEPELDLQIEYNHMTKEDNTETFLDDFYEN